MHAIVERQMKRRDTFISFEENESDILWGSDTMQPIEVQIGVILLKKT